MKFFVHSSWSDLFAPLAEITWTENKLPYCQAHGYTAVPYHFSQGQDILWGRVAEWERIVREDMADGDWLFFSGCDAAITQPSKKLESFIGDFDFMCSMDRDVVHGDCWMLRACPATRHMLRSILDTKGENEQKAFVSYLNDAPWEPLHVMGDLSQELLNRSAVRCKVFQPSDQFSGDDPALWPPGEIPEVSTWKPSYFVLHVGGKTVKDRISRLAEYTVNPPAKKILLTHYSDEFKEISELTDPSKIAYCRRWRMKYVKVRLDIKSSWERPALWKEHLQNCEGMFFMGADAMVTNIEIPPYFGAELVIAADGNGLNSDVFFMRQTPRTLTFLSDLIAYPRDRAANEQEAMNALLSGVTDIHDFSRRIQIPFKTGGVPAPPYMLKMMRTFYRRHRRLDVNVVTQRELNAYPAELYDGRTGAEGWQPRDFVVHLPGLPMEDRLAWVKNYFRKALTIKVS